jgi:hypothetical protein
MEMDIEQYSNSATCDGEGQTYTISSSSTTSLLKNGSQIQTLNSHSASGTLAASDTPGDVMPDGNGGLLAAFTDPTAAGVTVVNTNGSRLTFADLSGFNGWALGDNNTAFMTDGTNADAFNSTSVSENWAYASTGGTLSFDNTSAGGTVDVNDSEQGLVGLSSTGSAASPVSSLQGASPLGYGHPISGTTLVAWIGTNSSGQPSLLAGPAATLDTVYAAHAGDPQSRRLAVLVPTQLKVLSVIAVPQTRVFMCFTTDYAIEAGIHYQVAAQTGKPIHSDQFIPEE